MEETRKRQLIESMLVVTAFFLGGVCGALGACTALFYIGAF